jgi:superfamily II DNA or RNA helicase
MKIKIINLTYDDFEKKIVSKLKYQEEMDFLVAHAKRNNFIKNLSLSLEGNTLLLFQYVDKHGVLLYNDIKKTDTERQVFFIHGGVKGEEREEIRHIVENESNAIIVASYGTFSTGVNIKNLHNVIFASPSKSKIRNLQSIGRALRKSDTKDSAVLYDISDDLMWKSKVNYTMKHLFERIKIYDEEKFVYKLYSVKI